MSNISERYIPFANIANAVGVNANTVRAGQTILGVTGANHSGTFTYPVGSNGTTADMGTANTYRWVNATNVYNQGVSDADGRANTSSVNYQSGYNTGYNSGYNQGKTDGAGKTFIATYYCNAGSNAGYGYATTSGEIPCSAYKYAQVTSWNPGAYSAGSCSISISIGSTVNISDLDSITYTLQCYGENGSSNYNSSFTIKLWN